MKSAPDPLAESRRSLALGAGQRIEEMILSGELAPGSRINEVHLGTALHISRAPVREALRRLERHGLVETRPNLGSFVVVLDSRDIAELYDIRIALEELIGRRSAEHLAASKIVVLESVIARLAKCVKIGNSRDYYRANLDLHAVIVEGAGSRHLTDAYAGVVKRLALYRIGNPASPEDMRTSLAEHVAIVEALRQRDSKVAGQRLADHCRNGYRRHLAASPEVP